MAAILEFPIPEINLYCDIRQRVECCLRVVVVSGGVFRCYCPYPKRGCGEADLGGKTGGLLYDLGIWTNTTFLRFPTPMDAF